MQLSIVIVNWNSGELLRECLRSLGGTRLPEGWQIESVVVVDNASSDDSAGRLATTAAPLRLITNARNLGFAAACNQGARVGSSDLILFLNPDTRLLENSLRAPLRYLEAPSHRDVGIVGIQLLDANDQVARSCARFPRLAHFAAQACGLDRVLPRLGHQMHDWDHASTREVDQVIGAFFLTRRTLFDALGGFDERFFVYFEEVDFALRARRAGLSSVYLAEAQAFHLGGGSSGQIKGRRLFYSLRSRLQFAGKHFAPSRRAGLWGVTFVLEPPARALQLLVRGRPRELGALIEGYRLLWRWVAGADRA